MEKQYFNFVHSLKSEATKKQFTYRLEQFLKYSSIDLHKFLSLPQEETTDLIIEYLVQKKVSTSSKNGIYFAIKHACEVNDVLLNWKKIKKFIGASKTGNEIAGRDRGYIHEEIQQILNFSDQRLKTAFLILSSTGIRIGALSSIKIGDLERVDDIYKIIVYSGDKEQYITFTTPEAKKEIDNYLEFRRRRGEHITSDSYLIVKLFTHAEKGKPFVSQSLESLLKDIVEKSGIRKTDPINRHKRKQIPILHGFRKFYTKQLVDSNVKAEIREMLLGHKIGLTSVYYKPTDTDIYQEYIKAIDNLTIDPANRLKRKVQTLQIEKNKIDDIRKELELLKKKVNS